MSCMPRLAQFRILIANLFINSMSDRRVGGSRMSAFCGNRVNSCISALTSRFRRCSAIHHSYYFDIYMIILTSSRLLSSLSIHLSFVQLRKSPPTFAKLIRMPVRCQIHVSHLRLQLRKVQSCVPLCLLCTFAQVRKRERDGERERERYAASRIGKVNNKSLENAQSSKKIV